MKTNYLVILSSLLLSSCAQFVPPTGGIKDEIPPKLLKTQPLNKTINFEGSTVSLEFDEVIDVNSLRQDLLVIPEQPGAYTVKQTSKGVKLVFDQPFKDSTTYTLNFRNGIKDINERNPAQNLKLVFSTGDKIDSLSVSGKIQDLWAKTEELDVTVGLYNLTDTIPILKRKPDYFTKTDSSGNYLFENIKNNKYRLIAINDKNQNLLFDQKNDKIGFLSDTLNLTENKKLETIEIYKSDLIKNKIKRSIPRENTFTVQMERNVKELNVLYNNPKDTITYNVKTNELTFFNHPVLKDTLFVKIRTVDSLLRVDEFQQKVYFTKPAASTSTRKRRPADLPIISSIKSGEAVTLPFEYVLRFETPIVRIDTQKIRLYNDTTIGPRPALSWIDKNNTQLKISVPGKAKEEVSLRIQSNAFENYRGDTSANYSQKNKILKKDDMGLIEGSTKIKDGTKIAQLIKNDTREIIREISFTNTFRFDNVVPDIYDIRIIVDVNKNGIWDTGDFINNIQPEKILLSKEPIKLKANFEIRDVLIE